MWLVPTALAHFILSLDVHAHAIFRILLFIFNYGFMLSFMPRYLQCLHAIREMPNADVCRIWGLRRE